MVLLDGNYDGTYSLATVASDDVEIHAYARGYFPATTYPVVTSGAVTTTDIPLTRWSAFEQRVYRFFNMKAGTHFYTASDAEFIDVYAKQASTFKYDGIAYWIAVGPGVPVGEGGWVNRNDKPLYRFFNKKSGVHLYTADEVEKANVMANLTKLYTYEGVAFNVSMDPAWGSAVYRFYVPARNAHFYTTDRNEIRSKLSNYYYFEGTAFYTGGWEWRDDQPPASVAG